MVMIKPLFLLPVLPKACRSVLLCIAYGFNAMNPRCGSREAHSPPISNLVWFIAILKAYFLHQRTAIRHAPAFLFQFQ
jgi:hypothetical protein